MLQFIKSSGVKARNLATAAGLAVVSGFAAAQTSTDPFDTVLTDVTGKVTEYAGAMVVLAGVGVVFMIGVKYIKKLRGAA